MSPEAIIVTKMAGGAVHTERFKFRALRVNPRGGSRDCDGLTNIFAFGGSLKARESLVSGELESARALAGEESEVLTLDGVPTKKMTKDEILPENASVHLS